MIRDLLKKKPKETDREQRAGRRFEEWSAGLTRLFRTIEDLESRRADAVEVVRAAGRRTFEGEPFELTEELRQAARVIAECDATLPVLRKLHREERARNLSPAPRRPMRPVKINTDSDGTDFGGVLGGMYEAVPETEG